MNGHARRALALVLLGGSLGLAGCGSSRSDGRLYPGIYRGDRVVTVKAKPGKAEKEKEREKKGKQQGKKRGKGQQQGRGNRP